jgi:hypothetical protein
MKPFLSFQGSRACFFSDLFTSRFQEAGLRIPFDRPFDFTQGHEQRRMTQGCGFPHTQVAKRAAPSDSAELVAGRQFLKKRFSGLAYQENATSKQDIHIFRDSLVTELRH